MTEKIVDVMTAICNHSDLLDDITRSSNEYFFRYKSHVMSLLHRSTVDEEFGRFTLYFYPDTSMNASALASYFEYAGAEDVKMASYHSKEFGDEAFGRLFRILESKYLNIDDIFDDILSENN